MALGGAAARAAGQGDLGAVVGALHDALHRVAAQVLPLAEGWPRRPLHGDVHPGNIVLTGGGPLWVDLEDVCVGPVG